MDNSPHKSSLLSVNGIRLHYLDWGGEGPVLLFLAGLGCNAHIFDEFAPRFTDKFHVLALTRRGHGESDHPEGGYDIDTLTEDIREFLDCLEIDRVILAGHSLAGMELAHFSALHPERVLMLVFLEAGYDYSLPGFKAVRVNNPGREIQIPGADDDYYSIEDYAAFIKKGYPSLGAIWNDLMDEHFRHEVEINLEGKVVDKMSDVIGKAIDETIFSYVPENAKIQAPVLSIYAIKPNTYYVATGYMTKEQQNSMVEFFNEVAQPWNLKCIELFRENVPHARIVELPNAHHYCFIQQEEDVYRAMRNFLLEK
jgi:non-heme chloroperoxidase